MFGNRAHRLDALLSDHAAAVREFVAAARRASHRWLTPRAEGKWTPAQETQHVVLSYREFLRQLSDTTPMRVRTGVVRRRVARLVGLTSILWRKRIPVAVNAPREARPPWIETPPEDLIPVLEALGRDFEQQFRRTWHAEPRRRMSHYIFGTLTLDQGLRLVTVHTRHHAAFLRAEPSVSTPRSHSSPQIRT